MYISLDVFAESSVNCLACQAAFLVDLLSHQLRSFHNDLCLEIVEKLALQFIGHVVQRIILIIIVFVSIVVPLVALTSS